MHMSLFAGCCLAATVALGAGCGESSKSTPNATGTATASATASPDALPKLDRSKHLTVFAKLPEKFESQDNPITPEKVELGRMLYFEKRLSKGHGLSCNSCHDLAKFGVDNQPTSEGHKKQRGDRNSPTVYNAAGHIAQFWDGRAETVEAQASGPMMNPVEMAMASPEAVVKTLTSMPEYVEAFEKAFPDVEDPISLDNAARAIGAFERKLVTPGRFDAFIGGDDEALTEEEKTGLAVFVETGCTTCHNGPAVGGKLYQKLGLVEPWPNQDDLGRFKETKDEKDKMFFKVPSLRNIAKTGPYFHDGSVAELGKAVDMMAKHQLGKTLTPAEKKALLAFLNALTGELPKGYIAAPELPESTEQTPEPDQS